MSTTEKRTKRHYVKWDTYITRILKQVHSELGMTSAGMETMNRLSNYNLKKIMDASNTLSKASDMKTLTLSNISTSIKIAIPGELGKHAINELNKAVAKYQGSEASGTKESKAGLVWAVTRTENRIMESSVYCRKSESVAVGVAAVLEYLTAEILELAGNATRDNKKVRIKPVHIFTTIKSDEELSKLYEDVSMWGVVPEIKAHFIPRKGAKKGAAKKGAKKKKSKKSKK